jgi:hypothetical protein
MIVAKLSAVTGTDAPVKISWHVCGSVSPMVVVVDNVQPTAVFIAAVAFELCAKAAVEANKVSAQSTPALFILNCSIWGN